MPAAEDLTRRWEAMLAKELQPAMRIRSFTVQGFANFTQPITLASLSDVNAVYGANNSGKSNLIRAMELYFQLLGAGEAVSRSVNQILDTEDSPLGGVLRGAFNRKDPRPIQFTVEWDLSREDLEAAGLLPEADPHPTTTILEVTQTNRTTELRVQKWQMGEKDLAALDRTRDAVTVGFGQQVRRFLSDACPFQFDQPVLPIRILGQSNEGFPQSVRDALFDARQSRDARQRRRWTYFTELAGTLAAELGPGVWETTFDRRTGQADLIWVQADQAVECAQMSSGLLRFAYLVAELVLADVPYVCLEEPEWRLSPELQARLVTVARELVQSPDCDLRQLFITTHSPTLARCSTPFGIELDQGVPTAHARPWIEADAPAVSQPTNTSGGTVETASEPDLSQLVDLVEGLAQLDPDEFLRNVPPTTR